MNPMAIIEKELNECMVRMKRIVNTIVPVTELVSVLDCIELPNDATITINPDVYVTVPPSVDVYVGNCGDYATCAAIIIKALRLIDVTPSRGHKHREHEYHTEDGGIHRLIFYKRPDAPDEDNPEYRVHVSILMTTNKGHRCRRVPVATEQVERTRYATLCGKELAAWEAEHEPAAESN